MAPFSDLLTGDLFKIVHWTSLYRTPHGTDIWWAPNHYSWQAGGTHPNGMYSCLYIGIHTKSTLLSDFCGKFVIYLIKDSSDLIKVLWRYFLTLFE